MKAEGRVRYGRDSLGPGQGGMTGQGSDRQGPCGGQRTLGSGLVTTTPSAVSTDLGEAGLLSSSRRGPLHPQMLMQSAVCLPRSLGMPIK